MSTHPTPSIYNINLSTGELVADMTGRGPVAVPEFAAGENRRVRVRLVQSGDSAEYPIVAATQPANIRFELWRDVHNAITATVVTGLSVTMVSTASVSHVLLDTSLSKITVDDPPPVAGVHKLTWNAANECYIPFDATNDEIVDSLSDQSSMTARVFGGWPVVFINEYGGGGALVTPGVSTAGLVVSPEWRLTLSIPSAIASGATSPQGYVDGTVAIIAEYDSGEELVYKGKTKIHNPTLD